MGFKYSTAFHRCSTVTDDQLTTALDKALAEGPEKMDRRWHIEHEEFVLN